MVLVDCPSPEARRTHPIYGIRTGLPDWQIRTKHGRLEWRTLSGYWLVSPTTTYAVSGTVKAIIESFYQLWNEKKFSIKELIPSSFDTAFQESFPRCRKNWNYIWNILQKLEPEGIRNDFGLRLPSERFSIFRNTDVSAVDQKILKHIRMLKALPTYREYQEPIDMFCDWVSAGSRDKESVGFSMKPYWLENKKTFLD